MRNRLAITALVAFLLLDVVLVGLALRHVAPVHEAAPQPGTDPAAVSSPAPSSSAASPTAAPTPSADASAPLLLSVAADGTVLRATRGSCDGAKPDVEVSADGGRSFTPVPVAADLREVVGLDATSKDDLRLVGTAAHCKPRLYLGAAGASTWQVRRDRGVWHLLRKPHAAAVHAAQGLSKTPCPPVALSANPSVRLLCDDGRLFGTADGGSTWVPLGRLPGGRAIAFPAPGTGYALVSRPGCRAAVVSTADGGRTWTGSTCLGDQTPRAITANGQVVLAQVGPTLERSTDSGATWHSVG